MIDRIGQWCQNEWNGDIWELVAKNSGLIGSKVGVSKDQGYLKE